MIPVEHVLYLLAGVAIGVLICKGPRGLRL